MLKSKTSEAQCDWNAMGQNRLGVVLLTSSFASAAKCTAGEGGEERVRSDGSHSLEEGQKGRWDEQGRGVWSPEDLLGARKELRTEGLKINHNLDSFTFSEKAVRLKCLTEHCIFKYESILKVYRVGCDSIKYTPDKTMKLSFWPFVSRLEEIGVILFDYFKHVLFSAAPDQPEWNFALSASWDRALWAQSSSPAMSRVERGWVNEGSRQSLGCTHLEFSPCSKIWGAEKSIVRVR